MAEVVERVAAELAATAVARDRAGGTALAQRNLLRASGLLTLAVPRAYGGQELPWTDIYPIVRRLAEADSSLAHLFAFQHLQVASLLLYGTPAQQAHWLERTVRERWFWGNAANGRDPRLAFRQDREGFELDGLKGFCSGAADADALILTAPLPTVSGGPVDGRVFLALPAGRAGIRIDDDWDAIGQRQTDSGTVHFDRVRVQADEILGGLPGGEFAAPRQTTRQTLRSLVSQLILTEIFNGNALGALAAGRAYVVDKARPWAGSGVDRVVDDHTIQKHYGDMWVALQGAVALSDKAALALQRAWDRGDTLAPAERAEAALAVYAAKASATRAALDATARVFETMGAGAALARFGYDRYWRNVRTHTLHDPIDHKLRHLGRWLLTGDIPAPGLYS